MKCTNVQMGWTLVVQHDDSDISFFLLGETINSKTINNTNIINHINTTTIDNTIMAIELPAGSSAQVMHLISQREMHSPLMPNTIHVSGQFCHKCNGNQTKSMNR